MTAPVRADITGWMSPLETATPGEFVIGHALCAPDRECDDDDPRITDALEDGASCAVCDKPMVCANVSDNFYAGPGYCVYEPGHPSCCDKRHRDGSVTTWC